MSHIKNLNSMTLSEVLQLINDDPSLMGEGQPFQYVRGSALHQIFSFAYNVKMKFLLPEGDPPYTPSEQTVGMQSIDLLTAIKKRRLFLFIDPQINKVRREQLFINLLETVYHDEAKVLIAVKDQNLTSMYPNLSYWTLRQYGYLPKIDKWEQEATSTKSQDPEEDAVVPENESDVQLVVQEQDKKVAPRRGRGRPKKTAS